MSSSSTEKEKILDAVRRLPPEATIRDAMERLYFLYKVERGLGQADAGDMISHAEAKRRLAEWRE